MEREEIFGAIIVLVIILVIALIIYNMQGSAGQDIRQIANEVFGWAKQDQAAEALKAGEAESQKFINRLIEIHEHALSNTNKDCTYDFTGYELTDKYKVELAYLGGSDALIRFNMLNSQDEKLVATKTLDKKQSEWKIEPCYMEEATKRVQGGNNIIIAQTKDKMTVGNKEFYNDVPKLYKYDQSHLCLITKVTTISIGLKESSSDKYRNYFLGLKDCEKSTISGEEQSKEFFNKFIESINRCRSVAKPGKTCRCEAIDFRNMLNQAAIKGAIQENNLVFELYYNNKKIDQEILPDTKAGTIDEGFFQTKGTYNPWKQEQTLNKDLEEMYVVVIEKKELAFATPRAAVARGAFLRWAWAEQIEACTPDFEEPISECKPGTNLVEYSCLITNTEFRQTNMATKESIQRYFETKDSVLKGEYNGKKYSDYIYETSQKYGINPVVMLATMQKEQSLISIKSTSSEAKTKLERAFGCGISDNKNKDVTPYLGFDKQVDCAGSTLKKWYDDGLIKAPTKIPVNKGSINQPVSNAATYSLYKYTPYTSINGAGGNLLFFDVYKRIKSEIGIEKRQPAQTITKVSSILIDPGHGGNQPGAVYGQLKESDANLATSLKLKDLINQKYPGVKIGMTRTTDVFVDLNQRASMAAGYDLFIAIHYDSAKTGKALVYYPAKNTRPENLEFAKQLAQNLGIPLVPSTGSNYNQLYIDNVKAPTLALLWEVDKLDNYKSTGTYVVAKDTQVVNFLDTYMA